MKAMRDTFIEIGMPSGDAHITADIAHHATMEAVDAMKRVVDTAPPELRVITMLAACRILSDNLHLFMNTEVPKIIGEDL